MWIISMLIPAFVSRFWSLQPALVGHHPIRCRGAQPARCPTASPPSPEHQPRGSPFRRRPHLRGSRRSRPAVDTPPAPEVDAHAPGTRQAPTGVTSNGHELPPPEVGDGASGGAGCGVAGAGLRLRLRAARASLSASWPRPPAWCGCSWATRCCGCRCWAPGRPPRPRRSRLIWSRSGRRPRCCWKPGGCGLDPLPSLGRRAGRRGGGRAETLVAPGGRPCTALLLPVPSCWSLGASLPPCSPVQLTCNSFFRRG